MYIEQERGFSRAVPYLKRAGVQAVSCRAHSETSNVFRHEGDYWTLAFAGEMCWVRHTLGMRVSRPALTLSASGVSCPLVGG
jgi:hypothetical protein